MAQKKIEYKVFKNMKTILKKAKTIKCKLKLLFDNKAIKKTRNRKKVEAKSIYKC